MTPEQHLAIVREANTAFGQDFAYAEAFAVSYHRIVERKKLTMEFHEKKLRQSRSTSGELSFEPAEKELHG